MSWPWYQLRAWTVALNVVSGTWGCQRASPGPSSLPCPHLLPAPGSRRAEWLTATHLPFSLPHCFLFNMFFLSLCLRASSLLTHILLCYHFLIIRPPETWILLSLLTDYQIRQCACLYRSSDSAMTGNENGGIKTQLTLEPGHVVCLYLSATPINTHY